MEPRYMDKYNSLNKINVTVHSLPKASIIPTQNNHSLYAKADSGASTHSIRIAERALLKNIRKLTNGPSCKLPDGNTIKPEEQGELNSSSCLSKIAKRAYVHPALKSSSLISIGQLCDDGCVVIFDKDKINVLKNKKIIMSGNRNVTDGLWDIPLHQPIER